MPGIPKNRHNFTAIYRLGLPALRGGCAYDEGCRFGFGGSCADLLNEGLASVAKLSKLMLSNAGCKREIVNPNYYHKEKACDWLSSRITGTNIPARLGSDSELTKGWNQLHRHSHVKDSRRP